MSTQRLNAAEKDLEKFIKFLALKSTQVVVQSRLGEKIQTECNPLATGNDWFNIVIQDHAEIYAETKRALALSQGESILQRLPLCVEISLKTVEGDQMVLEVWSLDLQKTSGGGGTDKVDAAATKAASAEAQTLKAAHAIYNRMGILLKSLISLTRATPAYKLSRRQCADSYGIYYRIYVDRPQLHTLGEGHKQVKIGQLNTIVGALSMSVAYRTKMTITPTAASAATNAAAHSRNSAGSGEGGSGIMLKSNHFRPTSADAAASPTQQQHAQLTNANNCQLKKGSGGASGGINSERKIIDIEKPLRPGAFTDVGKLRQYTEEDYVLPETPPFEWLLRCGAGGSVESLNRKCDSPVNNNNVIIANNNNSNKNASTFNNNSNNNNVAACKNFETNTDEKSNSPTNSQKSASSAAGVALLSQSPPPIKSLLIPAPRLSSAVAAPPPPTDDDNLLKELNFPFASPNSHVNDLAKFYRDCYHAPPLRGLSEMQPEMTGSGGSGASGGGCATVALNVGSVGSVDSVTVDDLSRQLEQFETSLEDYDKLVSQLGLTASSSTGTGGSRSSGGLQMSN